MPLVDKNSAICVQWFVKTFTFTPSVILNFMKMKKYVVIMVAVAAIAVLSACASSKGNCPAYSQNNAQPTEQLAQR
jgi:hypothetical protein